MLIILTEENRQRRLLISRLSFGVDRLQRVLKFLFAATLRKFSVFNRAYKIGRIELPCSACAGVYSFTLIRTCTVLQTAQSLSPQAEPTGAARGLLWLSVTVRL